MQYVLTEYEGNVMLLKKSLSLLLCALLALSLCVFALPQTAKAVSPTGVWVGDTEVTDVTAGEYWRNDGAGDLTATGAYTPSRETPYVNVPAPAYLKVTPTSAAPFSVKLSPSGTDVVELTPSMPYLVHNAPSPTGALGVNGCTAWLHDNVLEVQELALTGAGVMPNNFRSGLYATGDLTIALHGSNSIAVADKSAYPSIMGDASVRAVCVTNGSLTLSGNGALTATVGTGYNEVSGRCCAVSCGNSVARLTVDSGVTLTATIDSASDNTTAVYTSNLTNNGVILAESTKYGVHLCGTNGDSTSAGSLTAISRGSSALLLNGGHTFSVTSGAIELTSAANNRAIGGTSNDTATLQIDGVIPQGLMGESKTTAAVCSSGYIMANYKSASPNPIYAYLRLPAGLAFTHSAAYDIPAGRVGTAITAIDVSGGASGGVLPYTFTLEGAPAWLSITSDGAITGTRPSTAQPAATATVRVTDSAYPAESKTITIQVGAVTETTVAPSGASISGGGADTGNQYPGSFSASANGASVLTVQAPCDKCVSVTVDGVQLTQGKDYSKTCGSTIITFTPSYLAALKDGTHSIRVQFIDGRYNGNFITPFTAAIATAPMASVPATGDMPLWARIIEWLRP